ncbi:MAG: AMP-binding protein [Gammaproteobacteria bacterium]|nr:AMP-binding protein [Gammaproteobacteria bacterium]MBP6052084.1 AMP-binding protein [Pseudomonadales bacterium]MBK7169091.1 AMP-binding protein [Gammaproteobacteria bacterium]MBK7520063.1 AMP-binding protein [Gammaproteobacteria bacterium]MBK7730676.1 AMP-binding protein [Gammaproteobacteria bacterium]
MNQLHFADIEQRHIGRAIAMQAQAIGERPFLLADARRFSFSEVNRRVNELAAGLAARGLTVGERLAFCMESGPEVIFLALAANKLGAVWVPINTEYKGDWLEDTIRRSRPRILVTDTQHAARVADVRERLALEHLLVHGGSSELPEAEELATVAVAGALEPDMSGFSRGDICSVLWTSGTTGKSKGVLQSHNVFFNAVRGASEQFAATEGDVVYSVLPMYNTAAWVTSILRALFNGLPLAIDPQFSVRNFWERVDYYGATQTFTLGAMHMFLWNAPAREDDAAHCLRKMMAIPMPPEVATPFSKRFGVQLMKQGLGQSEAQALCSHNESPDPEPPAASCGRPASNLEAKLVDDSGNEVPIGEPGELWVRPLQPYLIFSGYFDDPEATARAFEGEWYKTGDMLRRDDRGYYYFSDRKKDAVRYKGRNISTFEVELAARRHPAIRDCAAFGVPSQELASESELKLDVLLKPGESLTALELAQFINDNAPYFFVPRYIEFVDSLPYTPTNKLQKFKLRERGITPLAWDAQREGFKAAR